MDRWRGRVAIVTGASVGIGAAIAEKLVENGLKVVGLARREQCLKELAKKVQGQKGEFYYRKTDLSDKTDVIAAFQWVSENVGPVSLLVNNAGYSYVASIIDGSDQNRKLEEWQKMMDLNFIALAVASSLAVQIMKQNNIEEGHIVNINSVVGHSILPSSLHMPVYVSSKHAVTAFTTILRKELADEKSKIRVTSISPGLVVTDMIKQEKFVGKIESLPALVPDDIANALLFVVASHPNVQITELTIQHTGEAF